MRLGELHESVREVRLRNSLIHCRNRIWNQFTGHSIWQAAETAGILCEIQYQQVCNWTKNCCRCTRASLILSHLDPFCCLVRSVISSRFTAAGLWLPGDLHYACRAHHYCHFLPQAGSQGKGSAEYF